MHSMNKVSWIKVYIKKVLTNSFLSMMMQSQQWFNECSVFLILLNEDKNYNVSFEYLDWCLTQMKKTFEINNKKK